MKALSKIFFLQEISFLKDILSLANLHDLGGCAQYIGIVFLLNLLVDIFCLFEISGFKFSGFQDPRTSGFFEDFGIPIPTLIHTLPELAFEVREPDANNPATPEATSEDVCSELWYKSEAV